MGLRQRGPDSPLAPRLRLIEPRSGASLVEAGIEVSHPPPDGDQATQPYFDGRWLWQPTRTALHRVDPTTLRSDQVLTHRLFHDVHSVAPGERSWLVTCTGHETVVEIDLDGAVSAQWSLGIGLPEHLDGRSLPHDAFKPHRVHPNRAFRMGGRSWVTCLGLGACIGLGHDGRMDLGPGTPHDGIEREGLLWFTTTEGLVLGLDPQTGERRVELDIPSLEGGSGAFGWCRGIEVLGDRLWVGVTTLRRSPWREVARKLVKGSKQPTRLLEIDRVRGRLLNRWPLEREGTIYGVTLIA